MLGCGGADTLSGPAGPAGPGQEGRASMVIHAGPDDASRLTSAGFEALFRRLRDAADWGPADRRGALNNLTPAHVTAAAGEVRSGRTVSLAAPIETVASPDNPDPCSHEMTGAAGDPAAPGLRFAMDSLAMNVHGNADSHIDALCHVVYGSALYNGVDPGTITADDGAALSIDVTRNGIVGRGVLLDIPRVRGVSWLEPGDFVTAADLEAAERAQQTRMRAGDLLFVRVGHRRRRDELGAWDAAQARAGLHPTALPLLAERGIAALGSDGNNDTAPSTTDGIDFPVHVLAINAMGLHLLDYLRFEELVPRCEEADRWSFLCVIAPLRLPSATGSPVNPIAIL
jgi:kynurenine formamidase